MPEVIDSLVVTLALDPSKYTEGQRKALEAFQATKVEARSTAVEMESRGAQAAQFFGMIQNKVLGLAASYIGLSALKSALVDTTNTVAALGRVAEISGSNLQDLSAFGMAIQRNGGNAAAATQQVNGFIQAIERFKTLGQGSDQLQMFLGTVGAGANDTWLDILEKFSSYAEKNKNNPAQVSLIAGMAGITDPSTITELMKGPAGVRADMQRSRELGVVTQQQVEATKALQTSFVSLEQAVDTLEREIVTQVSPALIEFTKFVTGAVQGLSGDKNAGKRTAVGIGAGIGAAVGTVLGGPLVGGPAGAVVGAGLGAGAGVMSDDIARQIREFGGYFDPTSGFFIPTPGAVENEGGVTPGPQSSVPGTAPGPQSSVPSTTPSAQLASAMSIIKRLENSKPNAISPKGAIGEYQIMPATADMYGLDRGKLGNAAYNKYAASVILSDLLKRYNGNMDAVAIAYHSGIGAANAYLAGNTGVLGPEGRSYLARERAMTSSTTSTTVGEVNVYTNATDGKGIARDIKGALQNNRVANQANTGLQ